MGLKPDVKATGEVKKSYTHEDLYKQGGTEMIDETLETEVRTLRKRIHELETKIGWYKAVNAQLRDDVAQANADFQELARNVSRPRASRTTESRDALDAIVLALKRENDARNTH